MSSPPMAVEAVLFGVATALVLTATGGNGPPPICSRWDVHAPRTTQLCYPWEFSPEVTYVTMSRLSTLPGIVG